MRLDIKHHLDPATLMAYSAGTLGEALSAVASAHIEMCPQCREEMRDLDMVGAMLLEASAPQGDPRADFRTARPVAMPPAGTVVALPHRHKPAAAPPIESVAPAAFAKRVGIDLDNVPWRRLGPGVWHYRIKLSTGAQGDLRLLKIAAGKRMPMHGHGGTELTLVLDGAYRDENGCYLGGDVQDIDGEVEHVPVADETLGCICIIASERPAHYKNIVNRLLQPLTGI